ncbi:LAO/AO transporter kinase [Kutzneria sp. 744]|nr:LAO/AO transporter kinase [Kutzneria sp. 744]
MSWATPQALRVLDAAGCDVVLIETVGVGQSEVEVAGLADTTVVKKSAGHGDGIQAAKAGILEIATCSWSTRPTNGADQTVRELKHGLSLARRERQGPIWRPPVVRAVAARGEGIEDLVDAIDSHRAWLVDRGELELRRQARAAAEVEAIALQQLRSRIGDLRGGTALDQLAKRVATGEVDPYAAADDLIEGLR